MHIKETTETGAVVFIPLTQGKVAVIDFADFEKVRGYKWRAMKTRNTFYAASWTARVNGVRSAVLMHRILAGAGPKELIDHKDGDGLNNRRNNFRPASVSQNGQNAKKRVNGTSPFKGVSWDKRKNKWAVRIQSGGKGIFLGHYSEPEAAAKAYDAGASKYFGQFARTNFPEK